MWRMSRRKQVISYCTAFYQELAGSLGLSIRLCDFRLWDQASCFTSVTPERGQSSQCQKEIFRYLYSFRLFIVLLNNNSQLEHKHCVRQSAEDLLLTRQMSVSLVVIRSMSLFSFNYKFSHTCQFCLFTHSMNGSWVPSLITFSLGSSC